MSTHEYFSGDYQEARRKFLTSAEAAKAEVCEHVLSVKAPDGSKLAVDVLKSGQVSSLTCC
jgi:hypothetical protein